MTATPEDTPKPKNKSSSDIFLNHDADLVEDELAKRMIVWAAGLPGICERHKCRRKKRCFGHYNGTLPCAEKHWGLLQARMDSALRRLGCPAEEGRRHNGAGQAGGNGRQEGGNR